MSKNTIKRRLLKDEKGLSTVEYIIILALIAVACIAAWGAFGDQLNEEVGEATEAMDLIQGE